MARGVLIRGKEHGPWCKSVLGLNLIHYSECFGLRVADTQFTIVDTHGEVNRTGTGVTHRLTPHTYRDSFSLLVPCALLFLCNHPSPRHLSMMVASSHRGKSGPCWLLPECVMPMCHLPIPEPITIAREVGYYDCGPDWVLCP